MPVEWKQRSSTHSHVDQRGISGFGTLYRILWAVARRVALKLLRLWMVKADGVSSSLLGYTVMVNPCFANLIGSEKKL